MVFLEFKHPIVWRARKAVIFSSCVVPFPFQYIRIRYNTFISLTACLIYLLLTVSNILASITNACGNEPVFHYQI